MKHTDIIKSLSLEQKCALLSLSLRDAGGRLFSLGLLLYLMCDMLVAVSQFPSFFPAPLSSVAQVGMWLFYLPGQVLNVLSGLFFPMLCKYLIITFK